MKHNNKQIFRGSVVPPLSHKYPWFLAQKNLEEAEEEEDKDEVHTFYNLHDPMSYYHCQIPELLGKRIRGCFHGCWALLSSIQPHDIMWSLWNPFTSQIINLPPLISHTGGSEEDNDIGYSCLSAPPDHPKSLLFLTRVNKLNILCCRIGSVQNPHERMKLRWTEETFGFSSSGSFHHLTCCNSKVYAVHRVCYCNYAEYFLVEVDIVVNNDGENKEAVVISLLRVCKIPCPYLVASPILKGSCTELFYVVLDLVEDTCITTASVVSAVYVFKLDMNNENWEEMEDLKDTILSVELNNADSDNELSDKDKKSSTFYSPAIKASSAELGGYVHILSDKGKIVYSYNVKDKTLSLSSIPCLAGTNHHVSAWAMLPTLTRLESDGIYVDCKQEKEAGDKEDGIIPTQLSASYFQESENAADSKQANVNIIIVNGGDEDGESHLLNLPSHVLELLMEEFSDGVEYLKFRSTCKRCHLAAPLIPWNRGKRLQLLSPWLIMFDKHKGIITFTEPVFGDKFFIKTPQELICDLKIKGCKYGWLLIKKSLSGSLVFYNPLSSDIRELPYLHKSDILSFSAPPTSPDCIVVGTTCDFRNYRGCIHHVVSGGGESSIWRIIRLGFNYCLDTFSLLTFYGRDLYALWDDRGLDVFEKFGREDHYWKRDIAKAPPTSSFPQQSFLLRCDQHGLLHVMVGKFGESVEVFKLSNNDVDSSSTQEEWVKINSLGKHMIFISDTSSICIDAKTPHMENKIYFPRFPTDNKNDNDVVFYSLETRRYHTFNHESFGDFFGTKHLIAPHAWIEPTWS